MGYTTYDFYKEKYYGDSIAESLFPKWESRASDKLNQLTYGNIDEDAKNSMKSRKPPAPWQICFIRLIIRSTMPVMKRVEISSPCPLVGGQSALEPMKH